MCNLNSHVVSWLLRSDHGFDGHVVARIFSIDAAGHMDDIPIDHHLRKDLFNVNCTCMI